MNIVITGGAGFLGQRLAKALLHGSCPLAFDTLIRRTSPRRPPRCRMRACSVWRSICRSPTQRSG